MGNLVGCLDPSAAAKKRRRRRPNPFAEDPQDTSQPIQVLRDDAAVPHRRGRQIGDDYELGRELGRGEFGVTFLCTDLATGEELACKSISKRKLRTAVDVEDVRREVAVMSSLPEHPNVVRFRAAYEDADAVHLVMELCEGGELFDRILARGHYGERAAAAAARTVAEVVLMCHQNGVIHRDLKPENFLYAKTNDSSPIKAIDFGFSVFFRPGERFSEIVGSPYYMAPEVLRRNYGPEIDIWSAGVILYILLSGAPPFWAETPEGVAKAILRGHIDFKRDPWPSVSEDAKNLVLLMLESNPKRRLTAQQVLEHPWIQNVKKAPSAPLGDTVSARLKQFSLMNKFKNKAMQVIAEHLSVEQVEMFREMFKCVDSNNNGKVSFEELKAGLANAGSKLGEPEVKSLMEIADIDGDGALDYGEFVAVSIRLLKMENDEHLHKAFAFFDKDKSGYIEPGELREALDNEPGQQVGDAVLNGIVRELDKDKDGRISYEEFSAAMKSAGTDWRKASRQHSRERFKSLSMDLMKDGSLLLGH